MAPYKTSAPLLCLPAAANGVTVTPSGLSYGWSAWAALTPALSTDGRLAAVVYTPGSFANNNFFEIEIGSGALGAEVPIACVRGMSGNNAGGSAALTNAITLAVPADVLSSGARLSARMRQVSTNTSAWKVALQYYALPLPAGDDMPASTVGPVAVPAGSTLTLTTASTAWVPGAWVGVTAAADGDWIIGRLTCFGTQYVDWALDIGLGAPGAEVTAWTVTSHTQWFFNGNAWQGGPWNILLRPPFGPIPAGTAVSVRIRKSTSGVGTFRVGLEVTKEAVAGVATQLPMKWAPLNANFRKITAPPGVPNFVANGLPPNFSSWVEFIATTPTSVALCALASTTDNTGDCLIQLGVGAAGAEQVVANLVAEYGTLAGGGAGGRFNLNLPYPYVVPAGERVAIRMAMSQTIGVFSHWFSLGYIEGTPDFTSWSQSLIQDWYLAKIATTNATPWGNSAWVTLDASVPQARVITAYRPPGTAAMEYELDLGIGAAGAEQVITTIRGANVDSASSCSLTYELLPVPAIIPAAVRLAMRARCSRTATQLSPVWHYTAEPVAGPSIGTFTHDCDTGIFTITGDHLSDNNAALASVTRDGVAVAYTVLTQSNTLITFQLDDAFVNGTYCVVVTSDVGDTPEFCADFACSLPSCPVENDFGIPAATGAACRVANTFGT